MEKHNRCSNSEHDKNSETNYICKWCKRQFTRNSQHNRHETQQICRSKSSRTYCKICSITYADKSAFSRHLISRTHMDNLMKESATDAIANTRVIVQDPMYLADPLLTKEEAEAISMGNDPSAKTMTVYMKDPTSSSNNNMDNVGDMVNINNMVNMINMDNMDNGCVRDSAHDNISRTIIGADSVLFGIKKMEKSALTNESVEDKYARQRESDKSPKEKEIDRHQQQPTDYESVLRSFRDAPPPTERQNKILQYLARWKDQPTQVLMNKLKPVLAALKLPDANYLRRYIMEAPDADIPMSCKQVYVGYLDKFVEHIITLSVEGTRTHLSPDVPFEQLVINLCK